MREAVPGVPPVEKPVENRLDSWKEIAAYLKRDVTTVQRWEKREGMPVHRHLHDKTGSVYATRTELDDWTRSRNQPPAPEIASNTLSVEAAPIEKEQRRRIWRFLMPPVIVVSAFVMALIFWLQRTDHFWRNPLTNVHFQPVTEFDGSEQAAAISRDGHIVAFLSDRDGTADVWVTQVGSGEFHNLTHGKVTGLVNPSIRTLGFSPDGSLVTFWLRHPGASNEGDIGVWAVPLLGGEPRPYLQGVAEYDWSADGSRLTYHTPGPGDPLFVSTAGKLSGEKPLFSAPAGLHSHFPLWAPDGKFLYFVQGQLPDKFDIWRIPSLGGAPERITSQAGRVSHPVFIDQRTLLYLASDADENGPYLYSTDTEHRIAHRLTSGPERYTSLAASADGLRLVATLANPRHTLWRMPLPLANDVGQALSQPSRIALTTSSGSSPRLGPGYLVYVSASNAGESIWKLADGTATELWSGRGARIVGGPSLSFDGQSIAFSVQQGEETLLYTVQADGTNAHVVAVSLKLQGEPAWQPDGQSITSAADDRGVPHLYRIPIKGGRPEVLVRDYAVDPVWAQSGHFVIYSGPDIGTSFLAKAVTRDAVPYALPSLSFTRGARRMVFMPGGTQLIVLRGDIEHKDLWLVDLRTGAEKKLTNLPPDFNIRNFDVSPDGREVVVERVQEHSDVVLIERAKSE